MAEYSVALVGGPPWGFRVLPNSEHKGPALISQILPNSRASKEKIKAGDLILSINGKSIRETSNSDIQRLLKRASGILRLQLQRGSGIPVSLREDAPTSETETLIQNQPNNKQILISNQPINQKRFFLDEAAKKFLPHVKNPKIMTSVENLRMTSPVPPIGGAVGDPSTSGSQDRRWAPVAFTPMAGTSESTEDDVTFHRAPISHIGRPMSAAAMAGYIQSAPVTPMGPLSPSHSELSIPLRLSQRGSEDRMRDLDDEPKISITSREDHIPQNMTRERVKGQSLSARASPVPSQPMAITVSSIKRASYRTSRARERFQSLQAVHEGVLLTTEPTLTEGIASESNGLQNSYTTPVVTGGPSGTLPDGYEFRPESTISDHPSLATCSIDMDQESRQTDLDEMFQSGETGADLSVSMPVDESGPPPDLQFLRKTPVPGLDSRSAPTDTESSLTDGNPTSSFDPRTSLNRTKLSAIPSESEPPSSSEIRYPAAFENSSAALRNGPIHIQEDIPKPFLGSNYAKINENTNSDKDAMLSTNLVKGPSFRAHPDSSQSAVWSPRGAPSSLQNHSSADYSGKSSTLPTDGYTSPVFGYNPVRFVAPFSGSNPAATTANSVSSPPYTPSSVSQYDRESVPVPKPSYSRPVQPVAPPPPPSGPGGVIPSPGGSALPPPPPPPPPAVGVGIRPKQEPSYVNPPLAPGERSVIEYPEPQSVASLRSAIQTKLNGSAPVKGVPVGGDSEQIEIRSPKQVQSPQSPRSPPIIQSPSQQPPPPPPPAPYLPPALPQERDHPPAQIYSPPQRSPVISPPQNPPAADPPPPPLKVFSSATQHHHHVTSTQAEPSRYYQRAREPSPPRTIGHPLTPQYPAAFATESPIAPPRPPLPMSPAPPAVPPAPQRPQTYTRPYEDYRGASVPVRTGRTPPPPGSVLIERKSSIEGNQDTASNRRQVKQPEYKYEPEGRRTPLAHRQQGSSDSAGPDYQHHWYKMMYRKLHQIDRNEDQSILKYQMREYQTPPREHHYSAHLYGRPAYDQEPNPYTVSYKYSDYAEDTDYDRSNFFQPYTAPNFRATTPRASMRRYEKEVPRSVRSKSAGRYESGSPLPGEVVKSTPAGEKSYRITPKRIEDYVPGDSSLARLEDEAGAAGVGASATIDRSSDIYRSWKAERDRLSAQTRQRSSSITTRPDYPGSYSSRNYFTMDDGRSRRRDVSPPSQDEVRHWYRSIQAGGDVPYGGLRQPAPERRDSLLRTALHLLMKQLEGGADRSAESRVRDSATQVAFSSPNASMESSYSSGKRVVLKTPENETNYGSYWRESFKPDRGTCCNAPLKVATSSPPRHLYRNSPISPVQTAEAGAKRYAVERAQVADFHLPPFRTSPERKPKFKEKSHGPAWELPKMDKEVDWTEIEAYFAYLNREDKATSTKIRRENFRRDPDKMRLSMYVKDQVAEKNLAEEEYSHTCEELEAAIRDIEQITPESARSALNNYSVYNQNGQTKWNDNDLQIMQKSSSYSEGLGPRTSTSYSNSYRDISRFSKPKREATTTEAEYRGSSRQYCYPKLREKFQLIERGSHFSVMPVVHGYWANPPTGAILPLAGWEGNFYSPKFFIARTNSLPYISELSNEETCSSGKQLERSQIRSHSTSTLDKSGIASPLSDDNISPTSTCRMKYAKRMKSWISVSDLTKIGVASLGGHRLDQLPPRPVRLEGAKYSASDLSLPESASRIALQRFQYHKFSSKDPLSSRTTTDSAQKCGKNDDDTLSGSFSSLGSSPARQRLRTRLAAAKGTPQKQRKGPKMVTWASAPDVSMCRPVIRSPLASFYPSLVYQLKHCRDKDGNSVCPVQASSRPSFTVKPSNSASSSRYSMDSNNRNAACTTKDMPRSFQNTRWEGRPIVPASPSNMDYMRYIADSKQSDTPAESLQHSPSANEPLAPTSKDYKSPGRNFDRPTYNLDYGISTNFDSATWAQKEGLLEEERRKRQERELEDQRSRRHGFNPLPSRSPGIPADRFDRIFEDSSYRSPTGVELRGVAKAVYSFTAHNPREISFDKGDLIRIRRMIDQNWYEGEFKGRVGIIPVNYVEMAAVAEPEAGLSYTEVQETREGQAKAIYNFDGRNINELSLKKGEYITLTKRIDNNWFEGKNTSGRLGIFPSNYVHVLREPSSQNKNFSASLSGSADRKTPVRGDDSLSLPGGSSKMMVNGLPFDPRDQPRFSSTAIISGPPISTSTPLPSRQPYSAVSSTTMTTNNMRRDFQRDSRTPTTPKSANHGLDVKAAELRHTANRLGGMSGRIPQNADTYTTLYSYKPQNPDELELREGDIVYVVEKCDDGWFIGTSLRTGMFGTFPGNYVQLSMM